MSGKLYTAIAPLLAVVAFVALPATAQAVPHWYGCHEVAAGTGKYQDAGCTEKTTGNFELTRLPFEKEGSLTKTTVNMSGALTIHSATFTLSCSVAGHGKIWNTTLAAAGKGEIQGFEDECSLGGCKKGLAFTPEGLPWSTELLAGPPIRSKITGMKFRLICAEPAYDVLFTGELTPEFVNNSPSYDAFGEGSGHLNSENGELTFSGTFSAMGEGGEVIDAITP
jgi:hypothetical protein